MFKEIKVIEEHYITLLLLYMQGYASGRGCIIYVSFIPYSNQFNFLS